ncbi:peptidoglycan editing factor PgeF [Pseudomonas mangrovi]|uniref:Purine nucleoside phosphorylase n=1 Tax=Pseudomonas mangrovi TaxID=2161748 RepID=A0A2T5P8A4_9PSED|nr:peptidoglycan editing factor PgeF [Pseudomonas mangrovi]PTU73982.1 peptidoglycan editing factor PgeF [Pseudomonas mangrovi]
MSLPGFAPQWPAPANVRAWVTTCDQGSGNGPFGSFNLALHVGDQSQAVLENRRRLTAHLGCEAAWLNQVHGINVASADPSTVADADASWTDRSGVACAVLTADCLPLLFCDRAGTRVAAAHAGWRGLAAGVIEASLDALALPAEQVLVWLGPAISPQVFEVGAEVRDAFCVEQAQASQVFLPSQRPGHYLADIYALARLRLARAGVQAVYGGGFCTVSDTRFYSFRRQPQTGRFASLVWLQ